jgi:hypothetical protein
MTQLLNKNRAIFNEVMFSVTNAGCWQKEDTD